MDVISRREAHMRGQKQFYTGIHCKRGHLTARYVSNGGCLDCVNLKTPNIAIEAHCMFLPEHALFFGNCAERPALHYEAMAAFRYIEMCGWHEHAIAALRADPDLLKRLTGSREEFAEMNRAAIASRIRTVKSAP
jgi:hypothetical protein